jgi:hypothetical protein
VLAVVPERLGVLAPGLRRDDDHAVQAPRPLHPVVGVVHVGARAVDDEGVGEGVPRQDGALRHALRAVRPRHAHLPDAVPVDGRAVSSEFFTLTTTVSPSVARMIGPGVCPLMVTASLRTQTECTNW